MSGEYCKLKCVSDPFPPNENKKNENENNGWGDQVIIPGWRVTFRMSHSNHNCMYSTSVDHNFHNHASSFEQGWWILDKTLSYWANLRYVGVWRLVSSNLDRSSRIPMELAVVLLYNSQLSSTSTLIFLERYLGLMRPKPPQTHSHVYVYTLYLDLAPSRHRPVQPYIDDDRRRNKQDRRRQYTSILQAWRCGWLSAEEVEPWFVAWVGFWRSDGSCAEAFAVTLPHVNWHLLARVPDWVMMLGGGQLAVGTRSSWQLIKPSGACEVGNRPVKVFPFIINTWSAVALIGSRYGPTSELDWMSLCPSSKQNKFSPQCLLDLARESMWTPYSLVRFKGGRLRWGGGPVKWLRATLNTSSMVRLARSGRGPVNWLSSRISFWILVFVETSIDPENAFRDR